MTATNRSALVAYLFKDGDYLRVTEPRSVQVDPEQQAAAAPSEAFAFYYISPLPVELPDGTICELIGGGLDFTGKLFIRSRLTGHITRDEVLNMRDYSRSYLIEAMSTHHCPEPVSYAPGRYWGFNPARDFYVPA